MSVARVLAGQRRKGQLAGLQRQLLGGAVGHRFQILPGQVDQHLQLTFRQLRALHQISVEGQGRLQIGVQAAHSKTAGLRAHTAAAPQPEVVQGVLKGAGVPLSGPLTQPLFEQGRASLLPLGIV